MFAGKILAVAGANDLCGRLVAQQIRRKNDRTAMRLQRARRLVYDQALDLAETAGFERPGNHFYMPVRQEFSGWV